MYPSSLGMLAKLPGEIRTFVYQQCVKLRCAAALTLASRTIHHELNPYQYEKFVLTFDLDVGPQVSSVAILNEDGSPWASDPSNPTSIFTVGDHTKEIQKYKGTIPFEKLKAINIDIHCPDANDPGQLIKGFNQVTRFLKWLLPQWAADLRVPRGQHDIFPARCNTTLNLPDVRVRFLGTAWASSDSVSVSQPGFQHSIRGPLADELVSNEKPNDYETSFKESDLEILLVPFHRMRNARSFTVELPSTVTALGDEGLKDKISALTRLACSRTDFGLDWNQDSAHTSEESKWKLWLQHCQVGLQGPTAAQLRRAEVFYYCEGMKEHRESTAIGILHPDIDVEDAFGAAEPFTDEQTEAMDETAELSALQLLMLHPRIPHQHDTEAERPVYLDYLPDGIPPAGSPELDTMLEEAQTKYETDSARLSDPLVPAYSFFPCPGCASYSEHKAASKAWLVKNGYTPVGWESIADAVTDMQIPWGGNLWDLSQVLDQVILQQQQQQQDDGDEDEE